MASNRNRITRWNHRVVRLRRVVGLVGEESSFRKVINARLPFHSLLLAGIALLFFVAAPMTAATVACARSAIRRRASFCAACFLVAWIAIELAFLMAYSGSIRHPSPGR